MELEAPGSTRPEEPDFLCFLTHSPKTVVYDISLPASLKRSAEREVLFGELAARLPVPPESVCWFYRNCGGGLYRVCAVYREEIVRQLEFAASRSLKFDALIPGGAGRYAENHSAGDSGRSTAGKVPSGPLPQPEKALLRSACADGRAPRRERLSPL